MKITFLKQALLLCACVLVFGCSDDDENVFSGSDNHLIAFSLKTVEGTSYNAIIQDGQIVVTVPQDVSLDGASASYELCENATISPEPTSVTDWNNERQFKVTSYNGTEKVYIYKLAHTPLVSAENLVLNSQAEVDAFAETLVSEVDANVTIANVASEDPIVNLDGLSALKSIKYNLTIGENYQGSDLSGLKNLKSVGSVILGSENTPSAITTLTKIELPSLEEVGMNITINHNKLETFSLPQLKKVNSAFFLKSTSLATLELNSLISVGGNLSMTGLFNMLSDPSPIQELKFPALKSVGGNLELKNFTNVTKLSMPVIETVTGTFTLFSCKSLSSIEHRFKQIGGINFSGVALAEFDLTNVDMGGGKISLSQLPDIVIKGSEEMNASFSFAGFCCHIEGVKTVNSVELSQLSQNPDITIPFKHIKGYLTFSGYPGKLDMPELEYIDGYAKIAGNGASKVVNAPLLKKIGKELSLEGANYDTINFPLLEEVGTGDGPALNNRNFAMLDCYATGGEKLEFPKLKIVDGDCKIVVLGTPTTTISFPALETVGKALTIGSFKTNGTANEYAEVTTLNFPNLLNAKSVSIGGLISVTDFSDFKKVVKNLASASDWNIVSCGASPSYEEMLKD